MGASASMFDGVSGLSNHQQWMNIIGNNIANVNTSGFKDNQFNFADVISQTIRGASSAVAGGSGGTDSEQIGLGVGAGSIISNQQEGSLQTTNLPTDFAIQGDGFFIVSDGVSDHYTRDSNFIVDGFGNINMAATGFHLQGYGLQQTGNNVSINTSKVINLTVPQQINPAQETNVLDMFGNLQSSTTTPQTQSVGVYDSLGQLHNVVLTFTPPAASGGNWFVSATSADLATGSTVSVSGGNQSAAGAAPPAGSAAIHFNSLGQLDGTPTPLVLTFKGAAASVAGTPPTPWLIPGTTTSTNAAQAEVQLNVTDPAVGSLTAFASPTSLATQAVPTTTPLLGTQSVSNMVVSGNFVGAAAGLAGSTTDLTFNVADTLGFTHTIDIQFTSGNATGTSWTSAVSTVDGAAAPAGITIAGGPTTYAAGPGGAQTGGGTLTLSIAAGATGYNNGSAAQTLTIDMSKVTNTTLSSGIVPPSMAGAGNSAGALKDFTVDKNGILHGVYSNGFTQTIGQILLAMFENPGGLDREGNNTLQVSANSGVVNVGTAGSGRFGTIAAGNVETANVDLATEFSNMILAERGFQSNSRIITTSDEMLQEVVNLKR